MNNNSQEETVLLASLPYIDEPYDNMEGQINHLIEQEMKQFNPQNYLQQKNLPALSLTFESNPLLAAEYQRKVRKEAMPSGLDTTRYQLDPPATNKLNDLQAWKHSVHNVQSQLEHQYLRIANLELLHTYGPNAWRAYNDYLESEYKRLQFILQTEKQKIEELNKSRKADQVEHSLIIILILCQNECGNTLRALDSKWKHLIQKNLEIEQACHKLEDEIQQLKQSKS
jgi:pre-mRNA-splicing factor SPF27